MKRRCLFNEIALLVFIFSTLCAHAQDNIAASAIGNELTRFESFDREPENWEGINNRNQHFEPKSVEQNFGYSADTHHAGGEAGEVGGRINPAGEVAYYGYRLPHPLNLDDPLEASGKIYVTRGANHFLLGFFNKNTLNEWRTPNTLVVRINGRGEGFHCHIEYGTNRWRCNAGVIGEIVPGERIAAKEIPGDRVYEWSMIYDPKGGQGYGLFTFTLNGETATCPLSQEHREDSAVFTHFGLLPVLKAWDSPGEVWIDDVTINGNSFQFNQDPQWDQQGNRHTYQTTNTRPRFDFGWSPTQFTGGASPGEMGGLIFRGDCREPHRMGAYGDRIGTLDLNTAFFVHGKVVMLRGVTDSTASIGFYNSKWSLYSNPSQSQSIPMDYLGVNIEGPSGEGFFFYPVFRAHGEFSQSLGNISGTAPRIYPDRTVHEWSLRYDPEGVEGKGQITVTLDARTCTLALDPEAKITGATFDRFGICTPWIDGNSVTAYFDDLEYTAAP